VHAGRRTRPDVALFFIAGNSPLCLVTRWASIPAVINVGGLDSHRCKWPAFAKAYLRFAASAAPRWADKAITDSHAVAEIFERRYGQRIGVVPYGVEDPSHAGTETLERLGLDPGKYIVFVGGLEPENNPHMLVEAFSRIDSSRARGMRLAIVGGAPYADDYIRQVWRSADPRVVFPGCSTGRISSPSAPVHDGEEQARGFRLTKALRESSVQRGHGVCAALAAMASELVIG
jgi:glycosyltransferase involved in cell wall biosynthesis